MPPKPAPAAAQSGEEKGLKITISVKQSGPKNSDSPFNNYQSFRVRVLSEWIDCCGTTGQFGAAGGELPWVDETLSGDEALNSSDDLIFRSSTFSKYFDPFFVENDTPEKERLSNFNIKPGIYFIILSDSIENNTFLSIPTKFLYIDCSSFLLDNSKKTSCLSLADGTEVMATVEITKPLLSRDDALCFEPLVIDIERLENYPIYSSENIGEAMKSVYLYGELNFGSPQSRAIICFPELPNISNGDKAVNLGLKICYLPGLNSLTQFKELLTSTTHVLEVHSEDVFKRAFHTRNVTEFNTLLNSASDASPPSPSKSTSVKAKGKGLSPALTTPAALQIPVAGTPFGRITPSDTFLLDAISKAMQTSRSLRPHGTVRFRLGQLLSSTNDKLTKFGRKRHGRKEGDDVIVVEDDMLLEVRLEKASKPEKWDLPEDISLRAAMERSLAEEMSKLDGTLAVTKRSVPSTQPPKHELFFTSGTTVKILASLHRKLIAEKSKDSTLREKLAVTPFTRMIIVFKYLDDDTLEAIDNAVKKVNLKALPDIQGSMRSYSLTQDEELSSLQGKMDCISGFMIIDDDQRMVVLEGLAGPGQGMQSVYADLPRTKANDDNLTILCNPEILFPHRLYPAFCPDIRRIRIRNKLKKLARSPEIYNRRQVDELPFKAIDSLISLQWATDMRSTKDFDMFPSAAALNAVELLYGEAITRTDMDGTLKQEFGNHAGTQHAMISSRQRSRESSRSQRDAEAAAAESGKKQRKRDELVPTECRNEEFENYLRTRPLHKVDHIAEQRERRMQAWEEMLHRREEQTFKATQTLANIMGDQYKPGEPVPQVFLYSQQTLNYKALAMSKLREKVSDDHNASYTYSSNFMSQTLAAVDEVEYKKKQEADSKSQWLTKSGFQYPKRRTTKELIAHPMRPTDARIEALKEPFTDLTDKRTFSNSLDPTLKELELKFDMRGKADPIFGTLEPITFEKPFDLTLVGSRTKLPRGYVDPSQLRQKDPNFFRSVHVAGVEQTQIVADAKVKEKEDWAKKVVVEHTDFKVGGYKVRDKPLQNDRAKDILKDEPKRLVLKMLYDRVSHTGKNIGHKPTPVTIMNTGPFVDNAAHTALLRRTDTTKFVTMADLDSADSKAVPEDFIRHIHRDARAPKLVTLLTKAPQYDPPPIDKTGPKWEPAHRS